MECKLVWGEEDGSGKVKWQVYAWCGKCNGVDVVGEKRCEFPGVQVFVCL